MQATVVAIDVRAGDEVRVGQQLFVLESMKMEHVIAAEDAGVVTGVPIVVGQTVVPGDELATIDAMHAASSWGLASARIRNCDARCSAACCDPHASCENVRNGA